MVYMYRLKEGIIVASYPVPSKEAALNMFPPGVLLSSVFSEEQFPVGAVYTCGGVSPQPTPDPSPDEPEYRPEPEMPTLADRVTAIEELMLAQILG